MLLSSKLPGVAHKCFLELGSWPATNPIVGPPGVRLPPPVPGDLVLFKGPTKTKNSPDEKSLQVLCHHTRLKSAPGGQGVGIIDCLGWRGYPCGASGS